MNERSKAARKRVVVFISGGGSNMLTLAKAASEPDYPAEIVAVISDKADAGGLAKAAALGIATFSFVRKDFDSKDAHEAAILSTLEELSPNIICLAGYMRLLTATFWTQLREGDNKRRVAMHKLTEALRAKELPLSYVAAICRAQFKCSLEEASAKQLWCLFFTVTNRKKS